MGATDLIALTAGAGGGLPWREAGCGAKADTSASPALRVASRTGRRFGMGATRAGSAGAGAAAAAGAGRLAAAGGATPAAAAGAAPVAAGAEAPKSWLKRSVKLSASAGPPALTSNNPVSNTVLMMPAYPNPSPRSRLAAIVNGPPRLNTPAKPFDPSAWCHFVQMNRRLPRARLAGGRPTAIRLERGRHELVT